MKMNAYCLMMAGFVLCLGIGGQVNAQSSSTFPDDVCMGKPTGNDVFSIGEVRTSLLEEPRFQERNGKEWVLMDGRPISAQGEFSQYSHEADPRTGRPLIPDARGRFLRMANNSVCADILENEGSQEAYRQCLSQHDPAGERKPGQYQADQYAAHSHDYNDIYWSEHPGEIDILGDGRSNQYGFAGTQDGNNNGYGWNRVTTESGGRDTRPKNIAINFFVKLCECRTERCK